jgi:hypothetical protein
LTSAVQTDSSGNFTIPAGYTCANSKTVIYLVATGGNPGLTGSVNNSSISLMTVLGACGSLTSASAVVINEVTTVGSLAALFPFANGYAAIGSLSADSTLFAQDVANVNVYVNNATGTAPGPALASGYAASSLQLYALANSIAPCINSTGGTANDGSACGSLFGLAAPASGSTPTETAGAILNILKNATQSAAAIYNLAPSTPLFQPTLTAAPTRWALPIYATSSTTITVAVNGAFSVSLGATAQYTATVTGTTNQSVTWQVNGVTGGNAAYGYITPSGLYTAPAVMPSAGALTITAWSTASATTYGFQPVSLLGIVPFITSAAASTTTYGQSFVIDVQGTGFATGATLLINGSAVTTTAVTTSDLRTTVLNSTGASMQVLVAVQNPAPGATQSTSTLLSLTVPPPPVTQQDWLTQISQQNISPATAITGDSQLNWTGPDGRNIQLVVKSPNPAASAPTVTLPSVPSGADARPYFDTALAQVRAQGAGRLVIPTGTYTFKTLGTSSLGHLVIQGLTDVTIDGGGSTFIFTQNADGIFLSTSQRVQLTNFSIQYSLQMAALATMQTQSGQNVLVVDSQYPVTAANGIGHISEWNRTTNSFVLGGQRVYTPTITYAGNQTYTSPQFQGSSLAGKSYVIFQHYYGGIALDIEDSAGPSQAEDITLNNVTINSGPGMGIRAYGMKRGLGIWNSKITALSGSLISTEYDALHIIVVGGDVYLHDNLFSNQGDDAINLNNPVTPILSVSGTNLQLSTYSRFIQKYDLLSFFDPNNNLLGTAQAAGSPQMVTGLTYNLAISNSVLNVDTTSYIRDMNLVDSRVAVINNTIQNCQCHGVLVQIPNALVQGNTFTNLTANAIRLIGNLGSFLEGTGAINVSVLNNNISYTGTDSGLHLMPWSALSLYFYTDSGLASVVSNQYINVIGNTISNAEMGCITVGSSQFVNVTSNTCNSTDTIQSGSASISVLDSSQVTINQNQRTGSTTGGISVDTATTSGITVQATY